jgi:hypothetical protein
MADVNDFADYPKGRMAMGSGDLIDVTDITVTWEDGEKSVSTLRQNPAGSTGGARSCKVTFNSAVSHAGFERDYFGKYDKREVLEFRFKVPGKTFVVTGRLTSPELGTSVDDFTKSKWMVVGKYKPVAA